MPILSCLEIWLLAFSSYPWNVENIIKLKKKPLHPKDNHFIFKFAGDKSDSTIVNIC